MGNILFRRKESQQPFLRSHRELQGGLGYLDPISPFTPSQKNQKFLQRTESQQPLLRSHRELQRGLPLFLPSQKKQKKPSAPDPWDATVRPFTAQFSTWAPQQPKRGGGVEVFQGYPGEPILYGKRTPVQVQYAKRPKSPSPGSLGTQLRKKQKELRHVPTAEKKRKPPSPSMYRGLSTAIEKQLPFIRPAPKQRRQSSTFEFE